MQTYCADMNMHSIKVKRLLVRTPHFHGSTGSKVVTDLITQGCHYDRVHSKQGQLGHQGSREEAGEKLRCQSACVHFCKLDSFQRIRICRPLLEGLNCNMKQCSSASCCSLFPAYLQVHMVVTTGFNDQKALISVIYKSKKRF
jgi:hypothetical protein